MSEAGNEHILSDVCFQEFITLIYDLTGITIHPNRKSMVQGRLRKRVLQLALNKYEQYLTYVKSAASEKQIFIDLVTTNETSFFRTPRIWEYLEKNFLPQWYKLHPKQNFKIWSAAASSGEEAHSLGIICQEFKNKNPEFSYSVMGTDISQEMIQFCLAGKYQGRCIDSFQKQRPDLFKKYMTSEGESFVVAKEIRSRLSFKTHNLFSIFPSKEEFDLILLRNVLIYFTANDQKKVLDNLSRFLKSDGNLIIGESETLSHIQTPYKAVVPLVYAPAVTFQGKGEAA